MLEAIDRQHSYELATPNSERKDEMAPHPVSTAEQGDNMIRPADQPDERRLTVDLQTHPAAELFPEMTGLPLEELKEDISQHGQREPITLLDGKILDGRNRYRACRELGIEPRFDNFPGGDPVAYVISKNLKRRHLNEAQRASLAAKLENLTHGQRADYARQAETQVCVSAC